MEASAGIGGDVPVAPRRVIKKKGRTAGTTPKKSQFEKTGAEKENERMLRECGFDKYTATYSHSA